MQDINTHIWNIRSLKTGILSISKTTPLRDSDANISPFRSIKTRFLWISKSTYLLEGTAHIWTFITLKTAFLYISKSNILQDGTGPIWTFRTPKTRFLRNSYSTYLLQIFEFFAPWKLDFEASTNRPSSRVAQYISELLAVSKRNSCTLPNRSLCMTSILICEYYQSCNSKSNSFHVITVHI